MAGIILYEKMPFRTVTDQKRHILIIGIGYGYIRMIFETVRLITLGINCFRTVSSIG